MRKEALLKAEAPMAKTRHFVYLHNLAHFIYIGREQVNCYFRSKVERGTIEAHIQG